MISVADDQRTTTILLMSTARAAADPTESLGYLLKHASAELIRRTDAALEPFGIDSKDLGVLRVVAGNDRSSQQQVAATLGVDRTTMVALLDTLEATGVVTRRPDPDDRRRNVVELTAPGLAMVRRADQAATAVERELLRPVSAGEVESLRRTLRALLAR